MAGGPRSVRLSVVVAGLALGIGLYLAIGQYRAWTRAGLIGLTERPCTAEGEPITGDPYDDWAALCFYRERNARLLAAGAQPEVVMIGDSLTMGWPGLGPEDQDGAIVNRGIGRQSSGQVLLRFMADAVRLRPRFAHILVGTNDVAGTTGPAAPGQLRDNVIAMIEIARANRIGVILGTVPPARGFDFGARGDPREAIARANAELAAIAREQPGVVLADYHAVLSNPDGSVRQGLFLDGVHPDAAGYAAMRPVFERALGQAISGSR
ncbi:Lysophospholipase L1 [Novosphingobium sp. CF614]|uniref:GDSL-type esterase/lipase family protein n=1 Tax=Novosphingobium sp. CF614 TaxID=1884364 RepID=UPI0008E42D49|nr:GDSL-type esterase/lipase family protein [Novosphingobium sp. CF614]SFF73795.1 Lysophospholipase L1 [Novosphingobium sp. CF614]